jgi:hypothetical protein
MSTKPGGDGFICTNFLVQIVGERAIAVIYDNFSPGRGCESTLRVTQEHDKSIRLNIEKY